MIKIICDRCGKEVTESIGLLMSPAFCEELSIEKLDFCKDCAAKVDKEVYSLYSGVKELGEVPEPKRIRKGNEHPKPKGASAPGYREDIDNDKIRELRANGFSLKAIAATFGCSAQTIANRLQDMEDEARQAATI